MMDNAAKQAGFTLIQLSILLTVSALVLVAVLPGYQTNLDANRISTSRMNTVLVALRGYNTNTGTLPCPADATLAAAATNYGVAASGNGSTNDCNGTPSANYRDTTNHVAIGMVPVKTLGLSGEYALDGYGRIITYAVDTTATATCWSSTLLSGGITVTDNGYTNTTVLALISHGANGHGAWIPVGGSSATGVRLNAGSTDTDELTNAHVNSSFVAGTTLTSFVKKAPTSTFDDVVVYKNSLWNMGQAPTVIKSAVTVSPPATGVYTAGQTLSFTVVFNGTVTVTGTPRLVLAVGNATRYAPSTNTRYATYASGSGTTTLVFNYTVLSGDWATYGITSPTSIDLNGGTITSSSSNACILYFSPFNGSGLTVYSPSGIAVDSAGNIWVMDTGNNRIQMFTVGSPASYSAKFGSAGSAAGSSANFSNPSGLAIDASNNLWITNAYNGRVDKHSSGVAPSGAIGTLLASTCSGGCPGWAQIGPPYFYGPTGIVTDSAGNAWVVDSQSGYIYKYTSGVVYGSAYFGAAGSGKVQFSNATFIARDSSNNLYIADTGNNRIQKISSGVAPSGAIGTWMMTVPGTCSTSACTASVTDGQFSAPVGVAVDSGGNIWVADTSNNRLQKFNSAGTWLLTVPSSGCANGTPPVCSASAVAGRFNTPTGLAVDASDNVYVVDEANSRVEEFSSAGAYVASSVFGSAGTGNGQFNFR